MRYRHRLSSITALVVATSVAAPLSAQGRASAPKPDYSAPAGAPYTAEEVTVTTPNGSKRFEVVKLQTIHDES